MTSHIVGGAIGVAALVLCVVRAALHGNAWGVVGGAIFGVSMIALYTMSSVYHGLRPGTGKRVLQVIDHCTIYFLIAGTYTPLLLSAMRPIDPVSSWVLFGAPPGHRPARLLAHPGGRRILHRGRGPLWSGVEAPLHAQRLSPVRGGGQRSAPAGHPALRAVTGCKGLRNE